MAEKNIILRINSKIYKKYRKMSRKKGLTVCRQVETIMKQQLKKEKTGNKNVIIKHIKNHIVQIENDWLHETFLREELINAFLNKLSLDDLKFNNDFDGYANEWAQTNIIELCEERGE